MALLYGPHADFEENALTGFAAQKGYRIRYIPAFESDFDRLRVYQQLFQDQSPEPDICEIDCIWPALLAGHMVDLRPYLGDDIKAFPPELISNFTVDGKLLAIPLFVDTGILYYRSDLLRKYGFPAPPQTWDELEKMSRIIQSGERRAGHKNFWGYVWQGQPDEGLTCDALEWQISAGGGHLIEPDGAIRVNNPETIHALERAVSWVGTISPPGVVAYDEDDSLNVWQSGNAAFMRSWLYLYGVVRNSSSPVHDRFGVALVPGGLGGRVRMLGGIAAGVSKYSDHKLEAIEAIRYLTSEAVQISRARQIGSIPTRWALQQRPDIMNNTAYSGPLAGQGMTGVVRRPSLVAGKSYDAVSSAYSDAIHSALTRQATPREALARLETQLTQITGFRPDRSPR